jgi:hypothetical protein
MTNSTITNSININFDEVLQSIPNHPFIFSKLQLIDIVTTIENWDYSRVEKLVKRDYPNVYSEYTKYFTQYKYFLLVCVLNQSDIIAVPNHGVDMIWHCHLIINRDYNRLTQLINNNVIIYHEPD